MQRSGPYPVWIINSSNHRFVEANVAATILFGCSSAELLQKRIHDFLADDEVVRFERERDLRLKCWGDGGNWNCRTADGTPFQMKLRFHVTESANGSAFFMFPVEIVGHPEFLSAKPPGSVRTLPLASKASAGE